MGDLVVSPARLPFVYTFAGASQPHLCEAIVVFVQVSRYRSRYRIWGESRGPHVKQTGVRSEFPMSLRIARDLFKYLQGGVRIPLATFCADPRAP